MIGAADPFLTFVEVHKDGVGRVDGLDGADSVTVSPDGSHLYAAGFDDDALAVFSRNSTTGALTFLEVQVDGVAGVDGLDYAYSVTVSPDGKHLYVAAWIDDAVAVFSVATVSSPTPVPSVSQWGLFGHGSVTGRPGPPAVPARARCPISSSDKRLAPPAHQPGLIVL